MCSRTTDCPLLDFSEVDSLAQHLLVASLRFSSWPAFAGRQAAPIGIARDANRRQYRLLKTVSEYPVADNFQLEAHRSFVRQVGLVAHRHRDGGAADKVR